MIATDVATDIMAVKPACHPEAGLIGALFMSQLNLSLFCRECRLPVVDFQLTGKFRNYEHPEAKE